MNRIPSRFAPLVTAMLLLPLSLLLGAATAFPAVEPGAATHQYRILTDKGAASFPFEIFHGDIRFKAKINGIDTQLLLDDGFLWDELAVWGNRLVDALGPGSAGDVSVSGSDDAHGIAASKTSGLTLTLPGVEFVDQTAIIMPSASGVKDLWAGSEGQVSGTFLKNMIVDINFEDMVITLIEPEKFEYKGKGVEIPWKPLGHGPRAIPAKLTFRDGSSASLDLMMDLGYNDQLLVNTNRKHRITVPERNVPESLGLNIQGHETMGFVGRVDRVEIGGYEIKDVVAAFVPEEHWNNTFDEAMIGLGLLSRFNLVFDYSRERMFIEPNSSFSDPFEYNMSGLSLRRGGGDYAEVLRVHPASPASQAGLQPGDKIIEINGEAASGCDYWKLQRLLLQEGEVVELLISRDGREKRVAITLKRVI